jgi:hypothetical protein
MRRTESRSAPYVSHGNLSRPARTSILGVAGQIATAAWFFDRKGTKPVPKRYGITTSTCFLSPGSTEKFAPISRPACSTLSW